MEQNRYFSFLYFLIIGQVQIGKRTFWLPPQSVPLPHPFQNVLQNRPFSVDQIVGKRNLHRISFFKQYMLNRLNRFWKNIIVQIRRNDCNPVSSGRAFHKQILLNKCPAAPAPVLRSRQLPTYQSHGVQSVCQPEHLTEFRFPNTFFLREAVFHFDLSFVSTLQAPCI